MRMFAPARMACEPRTNVMLSMICGVVTARNVRGVLMYGSVIEGVKLKVYGGTLGNAGLASPWVKRKMKRETPSVISLMTFELSTLR